MTGMLTPVMAIPEINGLVLDGVKGLTARATGIDYAGRGSKRVTDDYTRFTDKMGAPGKFVSNLIVSGSHYAMAQSDYEMSYDDVLLGLYAFGGLRESRAAVQDRVIDKNNSYYHVKKHRSAPGLFEHRPQALRFHKLMDRPTGLNDFSLVHHPASRVDMNMFEGMKIEEVDLLNRPYNDGDSMQMSTGFLKSTNYRLAMIDTLETSGKSKVMLDRVYGQARATGIEPTNIIPTGKKQSYITQHAHVTADRVFIVHDNKVGFERDRKSTERVDAIMLVEKDNVLYDHGLSMAYNGDASITYYGISRLPKQVQKEYRERYKRADEVQKNGSLGTINSARSKKNPRTQSQQSQQSKVKSPSVRSDPRGGRDLRLLRRLGR